MGLGLPLTLGGPETTRGGSPMPITQGGGSLGIKECIEEEATYVDGEGQLP
jgi:hypothetical protein